MPTDAQMNCSTSGAHAQWFSHQKIKANDCDIIILCHKELLCYFGREL